MSVSLKNKTALITGASSGVGKACAQQLAALGVNLILTARRIERLEVLKKELESQHGIKVLPLKLDISDKKTVQASLGKLSDGWEQIDILINNAGVGVTTELMQNANPDDWDVIIDTNVKGLLYVTRALLPNMIKRNQGQIINIGSAAAHDYYIGGNVYSASKHAVKALTRSLRLDLKGYAIRVAEIDPGLIKTEFSEARWGKERADKFYSGFEPLIAEDLADAVVYCVTRPERVNIAEMLVYPSAQVGPTVVHREGDKTNSLFD